MFLASIALHRLPVAAGGSSSKARSAADNLTLPHRQFTRSSTAFGRGCRRAAPACRAMADTVGKPIDCLAAIAWEAKKPLDVTTVTVDPPGPGEVRVRIVATALCHTVRVCSSRLHTAHYASPQASDQTHAPGWPLQDAYTLDGLDPEGEYGQRHLA
jgi:hypothetical protein